MKIKIKGIYERELDQMLDSSERKDYIRNILKEKINIDDFTYTLEDYFRDTWDKHETKVCLDIIGNYLSSCVAMRGKQDKEILSRSKREQMTRGSKHYTNFSNLNDEELIKLGIKEPNDSDDYN